MERKTTESEAKAYQRDDKENRIIPYYNWHRTLDRRLHMLDVDCIEWRFRDGNLVAVAVIEVTRVDMGITVSLKYLNAILNRYEKDLQGKHARTVAEKLGTNAYIVLFREDCSEFYVYNLTNNGPWVKLDPNGMESFLKLL